MQLSQLFLGKFLDEQSFPPALVLQRCLVALAICFSASNH
jgi:hypothetical protein